LAIPLKIFPSSIILTGVDHRPGGSAVFEPFGLLPVLRAAMRKNESSRFAFFFIAKTADQHADNFPIANPTKII
jgi:hypothetical protein